MQGTGARRVMERVALIVDDEELVCRYTARVFMQAGLRVLEAHDGEEAITCWSTRAERSPVWVLRCLPPHPLKQKAGQTRKGPVEVVPSLRLFQ